jgi:hypothetical protein
VANARPQILPEEILDSLPAETPEAKASRRDLRVFNRLLGNRGWLERSARRELRGGERIVELGAGDGSLAKDMLARGLPWDGFDLISSPADWPQCARWIQGDLLEAALLPGHQVVVANLTLHHFNDAALQRIGARLREQARVIIVADLYRSRFYEVSFRIIAHLIGAHPVSHHDGRLSIQAGFRGEELPRLLGLEAACWRWNVSRTMTGAYRLLAIKRA